jgi:glutamyl-tRNA reductase
LDSALFLKPEATNSFLGAWQQAQRANTTGRFLDSLMAKAFSVAGRIRQELGNDSKLPTVADAAVDACRESLGDLRKRRVVILGAGQVALAVIREFQSAETGEITIVNRSWEHAQQLAHQCNVKAAHAESLWEQVFRADAVISAASQRILLTREELELVLRERKDKHVVIVDLAVPRAVDPGVRTLEGVRVHDLDDLCRALDQGEARLRMMPMAERVVAEESAGLRNKLLTESVLPTISAMRERLEQICHQEMDQLKEQFGPFTEDQELALQTLSSHITQRISATLARQLKELPGCPELTTALQQLFELDVSKANVNTKVCD